MANSSFLLHYYNHRHRRLTGLSRSFFFIPTSLALLTCLLILLYISTTSNVFIYQHPQIKPLPVSSSFHPKTDAILLHNGSNIGVPIVEDLRQGQRSPLIEFQSRGEFINNNEVFHDRDIFVEDYKEMNKSFKIYVYPHKKSDPFANVLLPVDIEPRGNYASESYFKKILMKSHFITNNPTKANLFLLPFSIARLRHDPRIGVEGIQDFVRDYISNVSHMYPYWNRSGGADHFYVACHSIGRSAMEKASMVKYNAIQVVCSSSYFLSGYIAHKDACLPQVWPREGDPPNFDSPRRKKLAFFAGSINSPVRERLVQVWGNDSEISVHSGRLKTPYADELLQSKFCLHVKGFEVNTARVADSLYYGCVPVVIANHYDLPFADILDWKSFSVIVATLDIPLLKKILQGVACERYLDLQRNVLQVRKHFRWNTLPVDYDAFYMVMYELWIRRSSVRIL